ncbi:MAG: adenylyl-sulfate kinase [Acidobacteriota bacterium]
MDFYPFQSSVKCSDRHALNGHRSGLVWFTGLSGSGKSTLAHAVEARLHELGVRSYVLDGDNIRQGLNKDLGLSQEDRRENIRRIAEVSNLMVDAGLLVFTAFIAPYRKSREFVRQLLKDRPYYECYVKCPIDICETRDPKGLYKRARAGEIKNMTGIGDPHEEPLNPDLVVETSCKTLDECVDKVITFLAERGLIQSVVCLPERSI